MKKTTEESNIRIGLEDLPAIKKAYEKATKAGEEVFEVSVGAGEGRATFLVSYAKYVIEYFESLKK